MKSLLLHFVQFGIIPISYKLIQNWERQKFAKGLFFVFRNGRFRERAEVSKAFGKMKMRESIPLLKEGIDSSFMEVSLASIKSMNQICLSSDLEISPMLESRMLQKLKRWETHAFYIKHYQNYFSQMPNIHRKMSGLKIMDERGPDLKGEGFLVFLYLNHCCLSTN